MQFGATPAHARTKAHDSIAVNAGQALHCADAHALGKGGNDLNLLVAGENIHKGAILHHVKGLALGDSSKIALQGVYLLNGHSLRGAIPGW